VNPEPWLPVATLWRREFVRFVRQRSRLVGALAQPIVFWMLLGGGLNASFRPSAGTGGGDYVAYFYPGVLVMVLLFTAIFATISTVEDRQSGFLQGVLVAPVSRWQVVLGQALGGTTLAVFQGTLFLALAPLAGIPLTAGGVAAAVATMSVVAFALTSLGLVIAWRMESTQGFHAIMNLILMPIWFLSGAVFPATGVPRWLSWVMRLNPLSYGMAALRRAIYWHDAAAVGALPAFAPAALVSVGFAVAAFSCATAMARRATT
jgi:ABC-2 type transport system permease protein